jgi:hypothetical protein
MLTHTQDNVTRITNEIRKAINKLTRERFVSTKDIYVSMPYGLQQAYGYFALCRHTGDRPKQIFGCQIVPAYENKVTVYFDEWQLAEIEPTHISITTDQPETV